MSLIRRSVIEQRTSVIQKLMNLKWSQALDEACREFGFNNYRNYLNELKKESNFSVATASKSKSKILSELIFNGNKLNTEEIKIKCSELGVSEHVKTFLIELFQKKFLSVGAFIPNDAQKLSFEFQEFNYLIEKNQILILGSSLISIKTPSGDLFEYEGAMKTSNQFDLNFKVTLGLDSNLSLGDVNIKGREF